MNIRITAPGGASKKATLTPGKSLAGKHLPAEAVDGAGKPVSAELAIVTVTEDATVVAVPAGLKGSLRVKDRTMSLDELRAAGKLAVAGDIEKLKLPADAALSLNFGPVTLDVGAFSEAPAQVTTASAPARPATAAPAPKHHGHGSGKASKKRWRTYRGDHKKFVRAETVNAIDLGDTFAGERAIVASPKGFKAGSTLLIAIFLSLGSYAMIKFGQAPEEQEEVLAELIAPELKEELEVEEPEPAPVEAPVDSGPKEEAPKDEGPKDEGPKDPGPQTKEQIKEKVANVGALGALKNSGSALGQILGGQTLSGDLNAALSSVATGTSAGLSERRTRGTSGGGLDDSRGGIGDLGSAAGEGRGGGLGEKTEKRVVAAVKASDFATDDTAGKLSKESIAGVVRKKLTGIKFCYNQELAKNPNLQGKVVVKFNIVGEGDEGVVKDIEITESTINNSSVEDCMRRNISRWKFPVPEGGGVVNIVYPFVFAPAG